MRIGVVGRGRVGGALAHALRDAGHEIVAQLGRGDALDVLSGAEVVILAVPDDVLASVADAVIGVVGPEALLIHTSGARPLTVLAAHGERIGIVHPAVPVASPTQSMSGVTFGVVAAASVQPDLAALIEGIGGTGHRVDPSEQVAYHAALVHASNHLVTLIADASSLLDGDMALLMPLLHQTLDNVTSLGPEQALTGPVVRGDAETVRAHLRVLPADLRASYRENARRALELARRSGRLAADAAARVDAALSETP